MFWSAQSIGNNNNFNKIRAIWWPTVCSNKIGRVAVLKHSNSNQFSFENLSCLHKSGGINAFISETIRFTVYDLVRLRMARADIWTGRQPVTWYQPVRSQDCSSADHKMGTEWSYMRESCCVSMPLEHPDKTARRAHPELSTLSEIGIPYIWKFNQPLWPWNLYKSSF